MPIYKGTTEITKISDLLTTTEHDIQWVYFGGKEVFTVWDTYNGTLPAQFSANGDDLKAYKVWGNTGGVGKETVNLWDGVWLQGERPSDESPYYVHTNLISVENATEIGIKYFGLLSAGASYDVKVAYYAGLSYYEEEFPGEVVAPEYFTRLLTLPSGTSHIRIAISENYHQAITPATAFPLLIIDTDTEPAQQDPYVPYGYEMDVVENDVLTDVTITSVQKTNANATFTITKNGNSYTVANDGTKFVNYEAIKVQPFIDSGFVRVSFDLTVEAYPSEGLLLTLRKASNTIDITIAELPQTGGHFDYIVRSSESNYLSILATYDTSAGRIPYSYTISNIVIQRADVQTTPIYIGTPALEKDEYIDSDSGKVYRRTENLFDGEWLQGYYAQSGGAYVEYSTWICFKNKIPCKPNTEYTLKYFANSRYYSIGWYTENDSYISMNTSTVSGEGVAVLTATSPATAAYLACSVAGYPSSSSRIAPEDAANTVLVEGSTAPPTHIPYLQPNDPPVSFPVIPTVDGTTIIEVDSTVQPEKVSLTYRKEDF